MGSSTLRSMRSTVGNREKDAVILEEHKMHTADELRSMRGALQPVRFRDKKSNAIGRRKPFFPINLEIYRKTYRWDKFLSENSLSEQ